MGLLGDSYFGLIEGSNLLRITYNIIFNISSYTRNGLFYVPIFLFLGYYANNKLSFSKRKNILFLFVSLLLMTIEGFILYKVNFIRHDSMYFMLIPVMFFLFECIKNSSNIIDIRKRNIATSIYIFHPYFIVIERLIAKVTNLEEIMIKNSIIQYILVTILTLIFAIILEKLKEILNNGRVKTKIS